jgi:hypothetical protein
MKKEEEEATTTSMMMTTTMIIDDSHVPENLPKMTATLLQHYPKFFDEHPAQVHVYQDAMPESLVDQIYEKTISHKHSSWGDYVTLSQIKDYWERNNNDNNNEVIVNDDSLLIIELTARYLELALSNQPTQRFGGDTTTTTTPTPTTTTTTNTTTNMWNPEDLSQVHGIAVWALRAPVGSQVPYHLDYAEQIRYESNRLVPPLLAGTLQCTRSPLVGGDFQISLQGIPHYLQHGYKARKQEIHRCGTTNDDDNDNDTTKMISIPYIYNQLTCHLGNLPHASGRVDEIIDSQQLRVIVGFNVFDHSVGPTVQQAPEHSDRFRRQVQTQKLLLLHTQNHNNHSNNSNNNNKLSLENIQKNKPLAKLLVWAKREKVKEDFRRRQEEWAREIPKQLPAQVQDLMDIYYSPASMTSSSSSPIDLQVFLHQQVWKGNYRILRIGSTEEEEEEQQHNDTTTTNNNNKDLLSPLAIIDLPQETPEQQ